MGESRSSARAIAARGIGSADAQLARTAAAIRKRIGLDPGSRAHLVTGLEASRRSMTRRRVVVTVAAAACAAGAAADAAIGATVSHPQAAASLVFTALPGETNHVTVGPGTMADNTPAIMVTDRAETTSGGASLTPMNDCVQGADMQIVLCPAAGITAFQLTLGAGDDWLVNGTTLAVQAFGADGQDNLRGGSGDEQLEGGPDEDYVEGQGGVDRLDGGGSADVVVARDPARDERVSCGGGQDLAIVDRQDDVARTGNERCELVDDGSQTKPRPGWVYVHPQRCSGEDVELGLPVMDRLVPLRYSILLPSGYRRRPAPTLDTSACPARLTATPGRRQSASANVSGSPVTVAQTPGRRVATTVTVKPPACAGAARTSAAAARARRVDLSTRRRRGRWRVKGAHSIGASFGTDWTTVDRCSSTTTIVHRGRVKVRDLIKRRTVTVRAGHRYVARR